MPLSSAESRRVSPSQHNYLVVWTCRVRQGKSTQHPHWTIKKTQTDRNNLSRPKKWGLLVLAPHLHSSKEKSLFTELGFGLTMQKMTTYSCRIGLVKPSAVPFTVWRELNSFEVISCFMDKAFIKYLYWAGNCPPAFGVRHFESSHWIGIFIDIFRNICGSVVSINE